MDFKNLDWNILYLLGEELGRSGTIGPFDINTIFMEFSDIPGQYLTAELTALEKDGLLVIHGNGQQLSLTSKAAAKIEALHCCLKELNESLLWHASGCCT